MASCILQNNESEMMQILAEYLEEEQTGVQNFEKSNWKFVLECN